MPRRHGARTVPIIATIIGEGGSGGALALGVANRVLVLEYGMLQRHLARGLRVDPLEGRRKAEEAATRLKMTAPDLLRLGVVDRVVDEPAGGAHQDLDAAAPPGRGGHRGARCAARAHAPGRNSVEDRYRRFRKLGAFVA